MEEKNRKVLRKSIGVEKINKLDDLIFEMELNQEKAHAMAFLIDQDYFDLKEDNIKLFYFDKTSIEHDILFDYVFKNVQLLNEARELLNENSEELDISIRDRAKSVFVELESIMNINYNQESVILTAIEKGIRKAPTAFLPSMLI